MDDQSKDNTVATLQWPDYLVIGIMLTISAGIGIYYRFTGGRQRTAEEYFSANRSMGAIPLSIALAVSYISAITMLGISAENYVYGTQITVMYLGIIVGTPIAIYCYLPVFFELQNTSVYEYLEQRFGMRLRLLASIANCIQLMMYSGLVLFAPSLALETTTGLSMNASVLLIGLICTFYSTVGGIKAVLITDVFQGVLMGVGVACVLSIAAGHLDGGLSNVWHIAREGGRINFFEIDPTIRLTWWCLLFGGLCQFLSLYAVSQVQVQRLLTAKDFKTSRNALILCCPFLVGMGLLTSYTGVVLYAVYKDCDPIASGKATSYDEILPFFAAQLMTRIPGITGLFISGVFSASLSTISAMLNSMAAIQVEDYVKPVCRKLGIDFPDEKAMLAGKVLGILNGFACLALAYVTRSLGSLVQATICIIGTIGGPVLGIYTLGMFSETANEIGTIVGLITALVVSFCATFGAKPNSPRLPLSVDGCGNATLLSDFQNLADIEDDASSYYYLNRISYMWYTPMGFAITYVLGYLVSLATNWILYKHAPEPDPKFFTPLVAARIRRRRLNTQKATSSQVFVMGQKMGNENE